MADSNIVGNVAQEIGEEMAERTDYEILGAWRAGYDWLHIYDDMGTLATTDPQEMFTIREYYLPAYDGGRRPDPPDLRYRHSYDLRDVTREMVEEATRLKRD